MEETDSQNVEWWHKAIVYQIYPRSFQDSNGDGVGDLPGVTSRLDYLSDLGIGAIWLSPFFRSPQVDFGYDISDFCDVDPLFGTLGDFDDMVKAAHEKGIKVMIDFVPGHSSDLHPWFQKSAKREDPYTDFYVWHDGKTDENGGRVPPNNWLSVFGGSSWSWHEGRQQYYFRPFVPQQPKLNYRCPELREEMKKVVRFWMDRGVDGMRADAVAELVETDDKSLDEPRNMKENCSSFEYEYLDHIYTKYQPESFEIVKDWADISKEYHAKDGISRFIVIEVYEKAPKRNIYRKYGGVPFNMNLIDALDPKTVTGTLIKELVDNEYSHLPKGEWPTFVLGNHDRNRVATRMGECMSDAYNMLLLTLKGTPTTYNGEELGMTDIKVTFEETQDPFGINMGPDRYHLVSRDPVRSPMQWDNSANAGFTSSARPWLPVHSNSMTLNVENLLKEDGTTSSLKMYRSLARLRQKPTFTIGSLEYALTNDDVFSYVRRSQASGQTFLVAINVGKSKFDGDLSQAPVSSTHGTVVVCTPGVEETLAVGQSVSLQQLSLKPGDGVVIELSNS